jgi:hypothetical protein
MSIWDDSTEQFDNHLEISCWLKPKLQVQHKIKNVILQSDIMESYTKAS